jgi:hypothetical protein
MAAGPPVRWPGRGATSNRGHGCSVALHAIYYNFVRIHQTLKVTPAMAAGVTDRLWEMSDVVDLLEAFEASHKCAA